MSKFSQAELDRMVEAVRAPKLVTVPHVERKMSQSQLLAQRDKQAQMAHLAHIRALLAATKPLKETK